MTMIQPEAIAGIDTHAETHHVAVIDTAGRRLGDAGFPATLIGYQAIAAYIAAFGLVRQVGVEGTYSYGTGITLHLQDAGICRSPYSPVSLQLYRLQQQARRQAHRSQGSVDPASLRQERS
ncbi:transposase [Leifsonia sp. NPDC014704]|uniref:IS110 family transposase n=1 Tax=Leifsonia sp. NPDC014704 TaxID=3364123 RepID=UPI0036F46DA9